MSLEKVFVFKHFYVKYIWKFYKNFFGRLYRSNGTKIHLDVALVLFFIDSMLVFSG